MTGIEDASRRASRPISGPAQKVACPPSVSPCEPVQGAPSQEAERKRKVLEEQERQREAAQREQEEEKRKAEAEIQRLKEIKPATLDEAVSIQVKIRVEEERLRLLEDFQAREGELRAEIKEATSKLAQIAGEAEVGA